MRPKVFFGAATAMALATTAVTLSSVSGQDLGAEQPPEWVAGGFVGWVDPFEPADVDADPDLSRGEDDFSSTDVRVRYGTDNLVEVWVPDVEPPVVARLRLTTPVLVVARFGQITCRVYEAFSDGIRWEESDPGGDLPADREHWFHGSLSYTLRSYDQEYEGGAYRCLTGRPEVAPPRAGVGTVTMTLNANGLGGAFTLDDGTWATFGAFEQDDIGVVAEPPATPTTSTTPAPPTTLTEGQAIAALANGLAGIDWVGIGRGTGGEPLRRLLRDRLIRFDQADGDARLTTSRFYDAILPGGRSYDPSDAMARAFMPRLAALDDLLYLAALEAPLDLEHDEITTPVFPTLRAWLPRLLQLGFLGRGNQPALRFSSNEDVRDFAAFTAYLIRHDLETRGWLTWLTE